MTVKNTHNEFLKNLMNGLVADARLLTDECGLHIRCSEFYFVKKA
jgi:hypothetical protein